MNQEFKDAIAEQAMLGEIEMRRGEIDPISLEAISAIEWLEDKIAPGGSDAGFLDWFKGHRR